MIGMTGLVHPSKKSMHSNMNQQKLEGDGLWKRLIQKIVFEYAAWSGILLLESFLIILDRVGDVFGPVCRWEKLQFHSTGEID